MTLTCNSAGGVWDGIAAAWGRQGHVSYGLLGPPI